MKRARFPAALVLLSASFTVPAGSRGQGGAKPAVQRSLGKYRLGDATVMEDSENGELYSAREDKLSESYRSAWYGVFDHKVFRIYGLLKDESGKDKFDGLVKATEKKYGRRARRAASSPDCQVALTMSDRELPPDRRKCSRVAVWEDANTRFILAEAARFVPGDDMHPDFWKPVLSVAMIDKKLAAALADSRETGAPKKADDQDDRSEPAPENKKEQAPDGGL